MSNIILITKSQVARPLKRAGKPAFRFVRKSITYEKLLTLKEYIKNKIGETNGFWSVFSIVLCFIILTLALLQIRNYQIALTSSFSNSMSMLIACMVGATFTSLSIMAGYTLYDGNAMNPATGKMQLTKKGKVALCIMILTLLLQVIIPIFTLSNVDSSSIGVILAHMLYSIIVTLCEIAAGYFLHVAVPYLMLHAIKLRLYFIDGIMNRTSKNTNNHYTKHVEYRDAYNYQNETQQIFLEQPNNNISEALQYYNETLQYKV